METIWKPQKQTLRSINSTDRKKAYKAFRNSSSSYISRKIIRTLVINSNGIKCYLCDNLYSQIDHVKSVYRCFMDNEYNFCNSIENLKPICSKCNQSKKP